MEDPEITAWMEKMIQNANDDIDFEVEETDTLTEARKLLSAWADQTETFQVEKPVPKAPKVAQYKKLQAPMMVVKKETSRPSVDPTLIMEARQAHVKEMRAQRLQRAAEKQQSVKPIRKVQQKIDVPDVDSEIRTYKARVAEKVRQKQLEIEDRQRRSMKIRAIEESAAQTIAQETKARMKAQSDEIDNDETLKVRLQLLIKKQIIVKERRFFTTWSSRCHFHSKTFERAALFSNFRRLSVYFSFWKSQLQKLQHKREMEMLERRLRREKQMDDTAARFNKNRMIFKAMKVWRARFKASIERKVIEEQHQKRRNLLAERIVAASPAPPPEPPKPESPKQTKPLKAPKSKITKLKADPRMEAMAKRAEEQKARRIEKAQREAQAAQAVEEERLKAEMETQRKKRLEHRQFLEQEKKKREEQKQRQREFEAQVARKKYCEHASAEFRLMKLKQNQFRSWHKIIFMKTQFELDAEKQYERHLMSSAVNGLILWRRQQESEREREARVFYADKITRMVFLSWMEVVNETKYLEDEVAWASDRWRMRRALDRLVAERRKRRKAKFAAAVVHFNRGLLRRCFRNWPIGCAAIREDEERHAVREDLLSKALQYLDEMSDDF